MAIAGITRNENPLRLKPEVILRAAAKPPGRDPTKVPSTTAEMGR